MKRINKLLPLLLAAVLPGILHAQTEPASEVVVTADIAVNTTWYRTNVYYLDGYVHVLAPATLTIEAGTIIKGYAADSVTTGENTSALFVTAGAKINAVGTPTRPIIFTTENDITTDPTDMGIYERGLWGGVVILGKAVLNTCVNTTGNSSSPKYDVFEGLPDNQISGQNVYRFGGNDDNDNSGTLKYVSIRHGGFQFLQDKELNGLSLGAVGRGTTIDHVETYATADDGFEFFGGTVNTKYLVSAFNDDDAFDIDQGYRGKNQFWFAIQEDGKRDSGGEWNGEPNTLAVSNAPIANFEIYNLTMIGAGAGGNVAVNHGLNIREYSAPRLYNSVLTGFNPTAGSFGVRISDARSGAMLSAGLLDLRENIVHGFPTAANPAAAVLFSDLTRSNTTVDPLLVGISRNTNNALDPRLQAGSPALGTSKLSSDSFFTRVAFKGAFNRELWLNCWTALHSLGFLADSGTEIRRESVVTALPLPNAPTLTINKVGSSLEITYPTQLGYSYQLVSSPVLPAAPWNSEGSPTSGTGSTVTNTVPTGAGPLFFQVIAQ